MKNVLRSGLFNVIAICSFSLIATQNLFAQFNYGTGAEGAVTISSNQTLAGIHNYVNFTINSGVTVTVDSGFPLIIRCTGTFTNNGTLTAAGGQGGAGAAYNSSDGYAPGGAGGAGGGGGWGGAGGAGGEGVAYSSESSANDGQNGVSFGNLGGGGKGGVYYAGGTSALSAGSGGSYGGLGGPGTDCGSGCGDANNSIGTAYGDAGLVTTATVNGDNTDLLGGSGGGGGGARDQSISSTTVGGWGGGGGGGAIRVTANIIVINTGSQISVRGGDAQSVNAVYGMGGGGSGGTINLQYDQSSPTVPDTANTDTSITNAIVDIAGGKGGNRGNAWYTVGGSGGFGRYLAQQDVSACTAPTLSAEANGTPSSISICTGNSVTLTANATGGSGCTNYIEYAWSNGTDYWNGTGFTLDTAYFAQADSTITFTPGTAATVTYSVTARCNALPTCTGSSSVTVTSVAQPTAPTTATPNPDTSSACAGTTVTLTGPASGGNAGLSCGIEYQYSTDSGTTWTGPSTTIPSFAAVAGTGVNIIQARRNNCQAGCTGPTAWNTVATWNGTTLPFAPSISISASSTTVCSGNAIIFTAQSSNGGIAPIYQWYKNEVAVGGDSTTYIDNDPASNDSVYAVITSNASCASPNTATSNVVKDTVLITPKDTISQSVCQGQSYDGHSTTGTFVDTFTAANGCDSIHTLNLTIKPIATNTIDEKICQGQSFDGYSASGTYVDTFSNAAADGCDSIRTINLNVIAPSVGIANETICQGQSYNGHTSSYIDTIVGGAASGCDSISIVNISVLPVASSSIIQSICQGESFGGHDSTGIYSDTIQGGAANGCDSISILNLTVLPVSRTSYTQAICPGSSFDGYSTTGTYVDTFRAFNGCDSIRTLNLSVLTVVHDTVTTTLCQGQSYDGHTASGNYTDTFSVGACDSIRVLFLTILNNVADTVNQSVCQGTSVNGHSSSGTYIDTLTAANGCDSIRTLNLTVNATVSSIDKERICVGDTFQHHTTTGNYIDTLSSSSGCDSIVTLELEVDSVPVLPVILQGGDTLFTESGYTQYNWYLGSNLLASNSNDFYVITQSGNYTVEVFNGGCGNTSTSFSATYMGIGSVNQNAFSMSVYPNPASDLLNIKLSGLDGTNELVIQLYDVVGRLVTGKTFLNVSTSYDIQLGVKDLSDGLYLLQIRQGNENIEQRVIIGK